MGGADPRRGPEPHPGALPQHADRPGGPRRHRPGPGRRGPGRSGPAHPAGVEGQHGPGHAGTRRRRVTLRCAVAPGPIAPVVAEAITGAGGELVAPERAEALVWTDPTDALGLSDLLAGLPQVRWVQLPFAGVDRFAGLFADG